MEMARIFLNVVGIFFIVYLIGYSSFLFLSVIVGSNVLYEKRRNESLKNELKHDYYVPISILVPAYNESVTIIETILSILDVEYKLFEIIIVDDGSSDDTSDKLIKYFNMHLVNRPINKLIKCKSEEFIYECHDQKVSITLIRKENGGKADSLNMGINASKYPYFICMDADTLLQYDSLEKIANPILEYDDVIATGGVIGISNGIELEHGRVKDYKLPKNLLASMQVLEYDRSFLASRLLMDQYNGSILISGAFGMFKKEIVIAVGGYDSSTIGEDMELILKMHVFCRTHNIPYHIKYSADAISWSQAPEKLNDLRKQRKRWHLGLFQSMTMHRRIFANVEYGAVSFASYTYFLLYELLSPFIELFGILTMGLAYVLDLVNIPFMVMFFLIYASFGAILTLTAFFTRIHTQNYKIRFSDVLKAVLLCFFENAGLRFFIAIVRMTAFIGYKEKKLQWDKFERVQTEN
jgi:cellulose synthase/poly-beta-1,6-N-acetylglucosamine synthase-like glycosyltransferase